PAGAAATKISAASEPPKTATAAGIAETAKTSARPSARPASSAAVQKHIQQQPGKPAAAEPATPSRTTTPPKDNRENYNYEQNNNQRRTDARIPARTPNLRCTPATGKNRIGAEPVFGGGGRDVRVDCLIESPPIFSRAKCRNKVLALNLTHETV